MERDFDEEYSWMLPLVDTSFDESQAAIADYYEELEALREEEDVIITICPKPAGYVDPELIDAWDRAKRGC